MKIAVMGTGTMGAGIVQVFASNGFDVITHSRRESSIERGLQMIEKNLDKLIKKGIITAEQKADTMGHIKGTTNIPDVAGADLVIEAIAESMEEKKALYDQLEQVIGKDTIIASNTSALSITELAMSTERPDKVIGMHFFNPVPAMKLIEVVAGLTTSEETKNSILELSKKIGKTAVEVNEAPGFVVNRLLIPMINEAIGVYADGVADAEGVDTAMKLGANHPMGPLELGDLIGLDICLAIMDTLYKEYGDPKYRAHALLRKMVRAGKLGRKTKQGFYKYD